jgi:hypothetical protein
MFEGLSSTYVRYRDPSSGPQEAQKGLASSMTCLNQWEFQTAARICTTTEGAVLLLPLSAVGQSGRASDGMSAYQYLTRHATHPEGKSSILYSLGLSLSLSCSCSVFLLHQSTPHVLVFVFLFLLRLRNRALQRILLQAPIPLILQSPAVCLRMLLKSERALLFYLVCPSDVLFECQ